MPLARTGIMMGRCNGGSTGLVVRFKDSARSPARGRGSMFIRRAGGGTIGAADRGGCGCGALNWRGLKGGSCGVCGVSANGAMPRRSLLLGLPGSCGSSQDLSCSCGCNGLLPPPLLLAREEPGTAQPLLGAEEGSLAAAASGRASGACCAEGRACGSITGGMVLADASGLEPLPPSCSCSPSGSGAWGICGTSDGGIGLGPLSCWCSWTSRFCRASSCQRC